MAMARGRKDEISGLPEGAAVQENKAAKTEYVYFGYNFRTPEGKIKQERDYLGTVEDGVFVPNLYYKTFHPVKYPRDPSRWKDKDRRARAEKEALEAQQIQQVAAEKAVAEQKAAEEKQKADSGKYHDFSLPVNGGRCVGLTAVAIAFLYENRMIEDLLRFVFKDVDDVINVVNLAVFYAATAKATYLADAESKVQQFIGSGCLSSPRASEFFERIGINLDLSIKITAARIRRLEPGALLAFDGTRIDCYSQQIGLAAVGKTKDGLFDSQINFSMLVDAKEGSPVGYRTFAGNINDLSTMSDFRTIWNDCGLKEADATIVMDRGYFSEAELLKFDVDGLKFLVGAKTNLSKIHKVITDRNCEFYEAKGYIRHRGCYGVKEDYNVKKEGRSATFHSYTFRNPVRETAETDEFLDALDLVEKHWLANQMTNVDRGLLNYFINPTPGMPLCRDKKLVDEDSHLFGFFSMVGNVDESLDEILDKYEQRNEVEVLFKLMFGHLLKTTRVQTSQALEALLLTVFVGMALLTSLRTRMLRTDTPKEVASQRGAEPSKLADLFTISEVFSQLQHVMMSKDAQGNLRLLNVTKKDKALVKALGFEGLFDNPENVAKLLSPTYMREKLATEAGGTTSTTKEVGG